MIQPCKNRRKWLIRRVKKKAVVHERIDTYGIDSLTGESVSCFMAVLNWSRMVAAESAAAPSASVSRLHCASTKRVASNFELKTHAEIPLEEMSKHNMFIGSFDHCRRSMTARFT